MTDSRAPDPFPLFQRTGTPDDMDALDGNIEAVADMLVAALDHAKSKPVASEPNRIKPEDARYLAYSLAVHRSRHDRPLTEHHLRLLAAALAIERPSVRAGEVVGLPPVKDLQKFTEAADAEAREPGISQNKLAKAVSVEQATIRAWRKLPGFKSRVQYVRWLEANHDAVWASWNTPKARK